MENPELNQKVITPDGKAVITKIDSVDKAVRVIHIEGQTPVTDYRFSDIHPLTPMRELLSDLIAIEPSFKTASTKNLINAVIKDIKSIYLPSELEMYEALSHSKRVFSTLFEGDSASLPGQAIKKMTTTLKKINQN